MDRIRFEAQYDGSLPFSGTMIIGPDTDVEAEIRQRVLMDIEENCHDCFDVEEAYVHDIKWELQ